jgi:hypothetical protein
MSIVGSLRTVLAATAVAGTALWLNPASASLVAVAETNAGDTTATAQDLRPLGGGLISGALSNEGATLDWVDMYLVSAGTGKFYASTGDGLDLSLVADPVLYLFDALGRAVAMDDESGGNGQALIDILSGLAEGDYYLAIAFGGVEPLDAGGNALFDVFGTGGVLSMDPLATWGGSPLAIDPGIAGRYQLAFVVPAPGTLALTGLGLAALLGARRARAQRAAP